MRGFYNVAPDEDGLLDAVPTGDWVMDVRPGRAKGRPPTSLYATLSQPFSVQQGRVTDVKLVARRGGRLRLSLHVEEAQKLKPRDVAITLSAEPSGTEQTLGSWILLRARGWMQGGLHFDAPCVNSTLLEPGQYRLSITAPKRDPVEQTFRVDAGATVDVVVDLESGTSRVGSADPTHETPTGAVDVAGTMLGQHKWEEEPIGNVLSFVSRKIGSSLKITEEAQGLVDATRATIQWDDVSAETALNMLTTPFELTWNSAGNTLWIGKAGQLLPPR